MLYGENDDYEGQISQIVERGFNCIWLDDGAVLLRDNEGNIRRDILISAPFGKYTNLIWPMHTKSIILQMNFYGFWTC